MDLVKIRAAHSEDAPRLLVIYAYYIEHTAVNFDYAPPSEEEFRAHMEEVMEKYPWLVLEEGGELLGFAYAGPFVRKDAYAWSAEVTIYLDHNARGRGFGRRLYGALEEELKARGIRNLYACIGDPDPEDEYLTHASERFHARLGYTRAGTFRKCGYKFGRWYNMIWMEKFIGPHEKKNRLYE